MAARPPGGEDLNGRPVHEDAQVARAVAGHGPLGSTAADGVVREAQRKLGAVPGDGERVVGEHEAQARGAVRGGDHVAGSADRVEDLLGGLPVVQCHWNPFLFSP